MKLCGFCVTAIDR